MPESAGSAPPLSPKLQESPGRPENKWMVLSVVSIATFMSTLDGGIMGVALPALADAFHTDTSTVLWVNVAYWVTAVGLMMTLGWIGDVAGRRRMFMLGFLVFTIGVLLSSLSFEIWQLIGARVIQGVGASMLLANLNAIIAASFPSHERGKAMGISGSVVGIGLSMGPLIGGLLLDALDWRALFYARAPVGLVGVGLGWWLLPRDRPGIGSFRVDYVGALALFGTLGTFLLVVNQGGKLGFGSTMVLGLAGGAALFAPVLVWSQWRSIRPIVDIALFKRRQYAFSLSVLVSHYLSQGPLILLAPFFFIDALGFSATKMGLFIAALYVMRTFLAPATGPLSDKIGPRPLLVLGNIFMVIALLWLSRLGTGGSEWAILSSLLLAGVGQAFVEPPVTAAIMGAVPRDRLGTASASVATGRQLAFAIGTAVSGAIFVIREREYLSQLVSGGAAVELAGPEAISRGFSDTLLAGAALALLGVALSLNVAKEDGHSAATSYGMPVR